MPGLPCQDCQTAVINKKINKYICKNKNKNKNKKIKQIITNQRFLKRTKQKKVVCGSSKFRERENKLFKN